MTQSVFYSPEADSNARRPRMNSNPSSIFEDGKAPLGRRSVASIPVTSRVGSTTATSATVTMTDTSGVNVGDVVLGAGVNPTQAVTTTDTGDLFGLTAHGIPVGTPVFLESIATTTGITAGRWYYSIAGTGANDFKLALTPGGSAIALTTDGTAVIRATRYVAAITANTSITLNAIAPVTVASGVLEFATMPFLVV